MNNTYKIFIVGGGSRLNFCLPVFIKSKFKLSGVYISKKEDEISTKKLLKKNEVKIYKEWINFVKSVNKIEHSIVFFISHNKIINPNIFSKAFLINYHASPLPKYRGGSPLNWAIINNEKEFGVTIHELVKSLDAGPILMQENFYIQDFDYLKLVNRVNQAYFRLTTILLNSFKIHWDSRIIQDTRLATYVHKRRPEDSQVSFLKMDAKLIYKMHIALPNPLPEIYFKFKSKTYVISKCRISKGNYSGNPGKVIGNYENGIVVLCKNGSIVLDFLRSKNSNKKFPAKNFLRSGDQIND